MKKSYFDVKLLMLINVDKQSFKTTKIYDFKQANCNWERSQSKMEKYIICVKKKKISSHICQFCLNLLSN